MGCSASKALAMEEINQLISQVRSENSKLENDLFKLKSQKSSNLFEDDKTIIKDFHNLHNEFSQEIEVLKNQMHSLTIVLQAGPENKTTIKEGIEKIIEIQAAIESKSEKLQVIINNREQLKKDQNELESQILEITKNIENIDQTLKDQEETLKSQNNIDEHIQKYEHEKMHLALQLKEAETTYKELREYLKDLDDYHEKNDPNIISFEKLVRMSDFEINEKILEVDEDIENITQKFKDIEIKELELQQTDNYLTAINQRLLESANVKKIKQQIIEIHDKIVEIKGEKTRVKNEILHLKRKNDNRYSLLFSNETQDSKSKEDTLQCIFQTDQNKRKKYSISVTSD